MQFLQFPFAWGQKCIQNTASSGCILQRNKNIGFFLYFYGQKKAMPCDAFCHLCFKASQRSGILLAPTLFQHSITFFFFFDIQIIFSIVPLAVTLRSFISPSHISHIRDISLSDGIIAKLVKNTTPYPSYPLKTDFCESPTTKEFKQEG